MMAYFDIGEVRYPLIKLRIEEMEEILADDEKRDIIGYPMYFDVHNRLWPCPPEGVKVVFVSDPPRN